MVRKCFIIICMLIICSCIPTKNDYDMARFKPTKFSIKPNKNKDYIKYVDTSSFYIIIHSDEFIKKHNLQNYITGFKFYSNGRVGFIKDVNFSRPETFNSKRASMGYYNFNEKEFYIETLYSGPGLLGSNYVVSKKEILLNKSTKDTLVIRTFQRNSNRINIDKYVKQSLPKEALNFTPDW